MVHIVIMGCGRVGATLARGLEKRGHTVAIIDIDSDSFRRLGADFKGLTIKGVGFDRSVLIKAGVKSADGFAAVSSGDNSNILAARVVRETFGVQNVVARIYDSGRAEVYERLGIPSVATVRWAADQVLRRDSDDSKLVNFTTAADGVTQLDGTYLSLEEAIEAVVELARSTQS